MTGKTNREIVSALEDFRDDAYRSLVGQGGDPGMIASFGFENSIQAFHGGQLHAMNEFLPMVAEALGRADGLVLPKTSQGSSDG